MQDFYKFYLFVRTELPILFLKFSFSTATQLTQLFSKIIAPYLSSLIYYETRLFDFPPFFAFSSSISTYHQC